MEIVANYLVGVDMAPMLPDMAMGADVIHLEADVHATADNVYGYPDGAWVSLLSHFLCYRENRFGLEGKRDTAAHDRQGRPALR